jgi:hypothetical protein
MGPEDPFDWGDEFRYEDIHDYVYEEKDED